MLRNASGPMNVENNKVKVRNILQGTNNTTEFCYLIIIDNQCSGIHWFHLKFQFL